MNAAGQISITVRNRQRVRRINTRLLKSIVASTLAEVGITRCDLCFHLVGAKEMSRINWQFLQHEGSTDVITFDNSEPVAPSFEPRTILSGEIFCCLDDAVKQAKEFGTSWQSELVRYVIHGILHLLGHDDLRPVARRKMKIEENSLLRSLTGRFSLKSLTKVPDRRTAT